MRILFIITRADTVGGAQVHVRDLSRYLVEAGHQVFVVTGEKGQYNDVLEDYSIQSYSCDTLKQPISLKQDWETRNYLIDLIRSFQPDLVSTHSSKAGILGRLACYATNTPCIFTAHGWAFTSGVPEPKRSVYQLVEKFAEPLADKIICVSENDRQIGLNCGMNSDRLITVHNGMPDIPIEMRANLVDDLHTVKIVMVARFDKQKDHQTLLEAVKDITEAQLDLIGDGPGLANAKAYATQNGMADRVNFLGFQKDVAKFLAQSHIFTLISNWEGFPRTIIEAMRAGLPVVASDVGGVAEAVDDGVTGYCIPRGNVDVLRDRLSKLVKDAELRQTMGQRGRQRYEAEFTFDHMFEKTFEVYKEVLAKRGKLDALKAELATPVSDL
ncbi:MAG: glycosyltransferase family 4 protein [Leptolyngbyaceae cyanobacterium MO_188.B28]|nr:glycosyltransferase family 4 protein [Leptolyngbyaceae cyanobacterium MO_188.B28]